MYAIIACGVFQKELERIAGDLGFPFEAHYLGAGLHVDFDELADALKAELEKCKDCEGDFDTPQCADICQTGACVPLEQAA